MAPGPGSTSDIAAANVSRWAMSGSGNIATVAASGAAQAIPSAQVQSTTVITLTAACAVTVAAPVCAGEERVIYLIQDATGSRLVTWTFTGGSAKWNGGAAPTLTTTAGHTDKITLKSLDGVNWIATAALNFN